MCEACTVQKTEDQVKAEEQGKALEWARTYAWDWFEYHAGQRTSMFNYGLAAAAILAAGYGSAIDKDPMVAFAIGVVGTIVSLSFVAVDGRNMFLVHHGEDMLRAVESSLMPQVAVGSTEFKKPKGILTEYFAAERNEGFFRSLLKGKHRIHMRLVQVVLAVAFALGACTAYVKSKQPEAPDKVVQATTTLATNVSSVATNVNALSTRLDRMASVIEADTHSREAAAKAQAASSQRPKRSQGDK